MKPDSNIDFHKPTRQSYVAILMILYKIYYKVIKNFWILLIPFFMGKKNQTQYLVFALAMLSIILTVLAIISFFRYKFYVKDNEFIVEKGVFSRKKIVIPFERIQSINFKQNIVHQIFGVVGLEIDTAGTAKKEFDFDAIDIKTGKALRDYIFAHKQQKATVAQENEENPTQNIPAKTIMRLNLSELVKIGLTQNHFKSFFLAFLFLSGIKNQIKQVGIDIERYADMSEKDILRLGFYVLIELVIFAFVVIVIISIIRNILKYYNLTLKRIPNGFNLQYGLFNRNEISVTDNKMQVLKWSDNLLRKILGLFNLQINLASSVAVKQKKSIVIPGSTIKDIRNIKEYYFPKGSSEVSIFHNIDKYYLYRRIGIFVLIFLVIVSGIYISARYEPEIQEEIVRIMAVLVSGLIYFIITSYLKYRKFRFGLNDEVLQINTGIFGNNYALYYLYKLQGVKITQSPVQKRKNLANLTIFSSSGNNKIIYINKQDAEKIRDFILFKIETDKREWM